MTTAEIYWIRDEVLSSGIQGRALILDPSQEDPRPLSITGGGVLIWELLLRRPLTERQLLHELAGSTGQSVPDLQPQVTRFLGQLQHAGFIDTTPAGDRR